MDGTGGAPEHAKTRKPVKWGWWIAGAAAFVVLALMLGSAALGWWVANQAVAASLETQVEETEAPPVISDETTMPDVRGLSREDAAQVLADSGFPASAVSFEEAPSAVPEGTVVTQSPVFGTPSPTSIVLGFAVPAKMPDLAGMTRQEAVSVLSGLGVAADVAFRYDADVSSGVVLSTSPETGVLLGDSATVTVATAGTSAALGDLRQLDGNCRGSSGETLSGEEFSSSVMCRVEDEPEPSVWALNAKVDLFTATVGIDDEQTPGQTATVEVLADGKVVAREQVAFGKPVEVSVTVTGVIQLAVRVTGQEDTLVLLGGAAVTGSENAIAELSR